MTVLFILWLLNLNLFFVPHYQRAGCTEIVSLHVFSSLRQCTPFD